ncbi:MAG: hypothetical protein ACJ798_17290 [Phenylobacterium sp.]
MAKVRFRPHHDAVPDTMWVGKGTGPTAWMLIVGILAVAGLLAYWLN